MTCEHRKDDYGLACTREVHEHEPHGHVYETGSHVNDRHSEGGHG